MTTIIDMIEIEMTMITAKGNKRILIIAIVTDMIIVDITDLAIMMTDFQVLRAVADRFLIRNVNN